MTALRFALVSGLALAACSPAGEEAEATPAPRQVEAPASDIAVRELASLAKLGGGDSRSPVLVREGGSVELWHRTTGNARWLRRAWSDLEGSERDVLEFGADELDVGQLPPSVTTISSPVWRNGRARDGATSVGWCPDFVRASDGVHLVFDRFDEGDYDVLYRPPHGDEVRVAGSDRFEGAPSIAVDGRGRVFVAWSEGANGWGRGGALHLERRIRLAVLEGGTFSELTLPPLLDGARGKGTEGFRTSELPRLVADERGGLWLFYRAMARWNRIEKNGKRGDPGSGSNRRVLWQQRVLHLSANGWTGPITLPSADGPGYDSLAALALPGGGVAAAYETDGRMRNFPRTAAWEEPLATATCITLVELDGPRGDVELASVATTPLEVGRTSAPTPAARRDPGLLDDSNYVRLWGDLHRHSDLSRCKMDEDGNVLDQYRYAVDVEGLDFFALTEHYQHMTPAHWEFCSEAVERFDDEGFAGLYGFEQAQEDGHRNLITADPKEGADAPFRSMQAQRRWQAFPAGRWVAIPHQLADPQVPLDWPRHRPAIESVVEIYQSRRGSYASRDDYLRSFGAQRSHPHALEYVADGRQFGFVAASDHLTTGAAFTAVYADGRGRDAVFEALTAGRTYAATARIALEVELAGAIVGETAPARPGDALEVRVDAGAPLARVEVIRNGELAHQWAGTGDPLLTVRMGASADARVAVSLEGARFAEPPEALRALAPADPIETDMGWLLAADLGAYEDVGLVGAVAPGGSNVAESGGFGENARVRLSRERREVEVPMSILIAGEPVLERVGPARVELRLDAPALGATTLSESYAPGDWRSGDWVVVRVVRRDGEMAWSSPIRVEGDVR